MLLNKTLIDKYIMKSDIETLVKRLVPSIFYNQENGLIVNVVRAFLNDISTQIENLDDNMYKYVNPRELNDYEILRIYHQTYLSTLNLDKQDDFVVLSSTRLFSYINELVSYKGSTFLMVLLSNLLATLVPSVRSTVKVYEDQLNDPNIGLDEKEQIKEQIKVAMELFTKSSIIDVEEVDIFKYKVSGEIDFISWHRFIKPFSHLLGWSVDFSNNTITISLEDENPSLEMITIDEMLVWGKHPFIRAGDFRSKSLNHYTKAFLDANTKPTFIKEQPGVGRVYDYKAEYTHNIRDTHTLEVETNTHDGDYDIHIMRWKGDLLDVNKQKTTNNHGSANSSDDTRVGQSDAVSYKKVILKDKRILKI